MHICESCVYAAEHIVPSHDDAWRHVLAVHASRASQGCAQELAASGVCACTLQLAHNLCEHVVLEWLGGWGGALLDGNAHTQNAACLLRHTGMQNCIIAPCCPGGIHLVHPSSHECLC